MSTYMKNTSSIITVAVLAMASGRHALGRLVCIVQQLLSRH